MVSQSHIRKEPVMEHSITYAALDDHKKRHQVAVLLPGVAREDALTWRVENTPASIRKMVRKVLKMAPGHAGVGLRFAPLDLVFLCAFVSLWFLWRKHLYRERSR